MKRIALVALSVVLAFSMIFALTGCIKGDEKVIKDAMTDQLNQLKNPNSDIWKKDMKSSLDSMSSLGIDAQQLVAAWTEGFDYKIGTITIDGNKATAELTITCKQINPAIDSAQLKYKSDATNNSLSESERAKKIGELIISELKAQTLTTTSITVEFTKSGNTWTESFGAMDEYSRALVG
jgi:hypothetical protein